MADTSETKERPSRMWEPFKQCVAFLGSYALWVQVLAFLLVAGAVILLIVFRPAERVSESSTSKAANSVASPAAANPALVGQWLGLFREYRAAKGKEETSSEAVLIAMQGNAVEASLNGTSGEMRLRTAKGEFQIDTLILHYFSTEPSMVGGVAFVLKGNPSQGILKGFWLGYDSTLDKLMSCPYVLGRARSTEELKAISGGWLDQPCYPASKKPGATKAAQKL